MRPLTNLLAVLTPDGDRRADLVRRWSRHGDVTRVHELDTGWIVAETPLPGDAPNHRSTASGWLACADGEERVDDPNELAHAMRHQPSELERTLGDITALLLYNNGASAIRSPSGLVSLYWFVDDETVAIGTCLTWFERHLDRPFAMDALAHAVAIDGVSVVDRRSPLQEVNSVAVGGHVDLDRGGAANHHRWWRPQQLTPSRPQAGAAAAAATRLRTILIDRLQADLDPADTNLIGLSGGVDSSCLGALAAGPAERPLQAFTFLPAQDHPALGELEPYVDCIADVVGPSRHVRLKMNELDSLTIAAQAPIVSVPIVHPALGFLGGLAKESPLTVYTGGEAADDLFGGPFVLGKDWIEDVPIWQLIQSLRRPWNDTGRRFVLRQWYDAKRNTRELPLPMDDVFAGFRDDIRSDYADWYADVDRRVASSAHPWRHLLAFFEFDGWQRQNWEACSELGVRRSFPFWCRETIELALSLLPRQHALPPKRLIRDGLRADVPAMNLDRADKGPWAEAPTVHWPLGALEPRLAPLLQDQLIGSTPTEIDFYEASVLATLMASTRPVAER